MFSLFLLAFEALYHLFVKALMNVLPIFKVVLEIKTELKSFGSRVGRIVLLEEPNGAFVHELVKQPLWMERALSLCKVLFRVDSKIIVIG